MTDQTPYPGDEAEVASDRAAPPGTPTWVKVFGIIGIVVVLLVVVLLVFGGGPGQHGPGRHLPSGAPGITAMMYQR